MSRAINPESEAVYSLMRSKFAEAIGDKTNVGEAMMDAGWETVVSLLADPTIAAGVALDVGSVVALTKVARPLTPDEEFDLRIFAAGDMETPDDFMATLTFWCFNRRGGLMDDALAVAAGVESA